MIVADVQGLGDFSSQWGPFMAAQDEGDRFVGRARPSLPKSVLRGAALPKGVGGRLGSPRLPTPEAKDQTGTAVVATAPAAAASTRGLADLWRKVKTQPAYTAGAVVVGLVLMKALSK